MMQKELTIGMEPEYLPPLKKEVYFINLYCNKIFEIMQKSQVVQNEYAYMRRRRRCMHEISKMPFATIYRDFKSHPASSDV
jgi:hypothetical protein